MPLRCGAAAASDDRAPQKCSAVRNRSAPRRWSRPSDDELRILRQQLAEQVADGEKVLAELLDDGRWNGWITMSSDLLDRAFETDRWTRDFEGATGGSSF